MVAPPSKFYTVSTVLFHKYGGANVAVTICMSHFYIVSPTKATVILDNGNMENYQVIGIIYVPFLTVLLYNQWEQFMIVQVTLPTPSHQAPSNFKLAFKRLYLNFLNIVALLTLKVVLGDYPTRLETILTIFKLIL